MKKHCLDLTVSSVGRLSDKHVLLKLTCDEPLPEMCPGQFVEVKIDNSPSTFLRRPISINFVDLDNNQLWLLVATVGEGTHHLYNINPGDTLNCLLPLGNGFSEVGVFRGAPNTVASLVTGSEECASGVACGQEGHCCKVLLVGGGVGVAPLLWQGIRLRERGVEPVFLLGARSAKDLLELELFEKVGRVCVTTEDGSAGERGVVTNHSVLQEERFCMIQTCGPKPMMKAVVRYAKEKGIECEVSLENMMACGLGACLCCVEKTTDGNLRVCEDGPVFNIKKLLW